MVEQIRPTRILVAAHKVYSMPADSVYLPVSVGAALQDGVVPYQRDDVGENISRKNRSWCELTALYWAWKNLPADVLGLVHYRRLLKGTDGPLSEKDICRYLEQADAILPRPRNYWIETNYSQYAHAHHAIDLDLTRMILSERYPEYLPSFDASMQSTKGHRFNMFVMKRTIADNYCSWLFDILFELEYRLDISKYSEYDSRVFGFVAERLLDTWLVFNGIRYVEVPVLNLESQHWIRKIFCFLKRKFCRK